jgi:hypothetical protein
VSIGAVRFRPAGIRFLAAFLTRLCKRPFAASELADALYRVEMRKDETHIVIEGAHLFVGEHPALIFNTPKSSFRRASWPSLIIATKAASVSFCPNAKVTRRVHVVARR